MRSEGVAQCLGRCAGAGLHQGGRLPGRGEPAGARDAPQRVVEALKITSHTLQAQRSQEGTIVTVKDLINLPREASPRTPSRSVHMCRSVIVSVFCALHWQYLAVSRHMILCVWTWLRLQKEP